MTEATRLLLNLQYGFYVFFSPWITIFIGLAVAGAIMETFFSFIIRPVQRVEITRRMDEG